MQSRIVLRLGVPTVSEVQEDARKLARIAFSLLTPIALMAGALAVWRLGVDLDWTGQFPIESGLFSHWQVWLAIAIGLQVAAGRLRREARGR